MEETENQEDVLEQAAQGITALADLVSGMYGPKGGIALHTDGDLEVIHEPYRYLSRLDIQHPSAFLVFNNATSTWHAFRDGVGRHVLLIGHLMSRAHELIRAGLNRSLVSESLHQVALEIPKRLERLKVLLPIDRWEARSLIRTAVPYINEIIDIHHFSDEVFDTFSYLYDIKGETRLITAIQDHLFIRGVTSPVKGGLETRPGMVLFEREFKATPGLDGSKDKYRAVVLEDRSGESFLKNIEFDIEEHDPDNPISIFDIAAKRLQSMSIDLVITNISKNINVLKDVLRSRGIEVLDSLPSQRFQEIKSMFGSSVPMSLNIERNSILNLGVETIMLEGGKGLYLRCGEDYNTVLIHIPHGFMKDAVENMYLTALFTLNSAMMEGEFTVLPGGGGWETYLAMGLTEEVLTREDKSALVFEACAHAFQDLVMTLAQNNGMKPLDTVGDLREKWDLGTMAGMNADTGQITDVLAGSIHDPYSLAVYVAASSVETVSSILRIDGFLQSRPLNYYKADEDRPEMDDFEMIEKYGDKPFGSV